MPLRLVLLTLTQYQIYFGIENIIGSAEDDALTGNNVDNIIEGGDGDDVLLPGSAGSDTVSYRSSDRAVDVDLSDAVATSRSSGGHAGGDTIGANGDEATAEGFEKLSDLLMMMT